METLFAIGVGAYGAAAASFAASLIKNRPIFAVWGRRVLAGAVAFWSGLLVWRISQAGLGTEVWLALSALGLSGVYLAAAARYPLRPLGSFITTISAVLCLLALTAEPGTRHFVPLILGVHIGLAFIGITAFAFASALAMTYLLHARLLRSRSRAKLELVRRLPPLEVLDNLSLRATTVGFPLFTLSLLLGAFYAVRTSSGLSISWVLAITAWIVYLGVIQTRLVMGWQGARAAKATVLGFAVLMAVAASYALKVG